MAFFASGLMVSMIRVVFPGMQSGPISLSNRDGEARIVTGPVGRGRPGMARVSVGRGQNLDVKGEPFFGDAVLEVGCKVILLRLADKSIRFVALSGSADIRDQ